MRILGSSENKYAQYIKNIHCEYSFLDETQYKKLRKKVCSSSERQVNDINPANIHLSIFPGSAKFSTDTKHFCYEIFSW